MIKHDALQRLSSLKNELEAAIASEYAKVCQLTGREFAERTGLNLPSAKQVLSRFKRKPVVRPGILKLNESHPLHGYKAVLGSIKAKQVREILKDFAYPFSYQQLLKVDFLYNNSLVTPDFLQRYIEAIEKCGYDGIGEIRHEGRVFDGRQEVLVVKTGDISSWVMWESVSRLIVKSDTLPPQTFVMSNGKYTITPPDERISFNPNALEYHLACRHCRALGYDFVHEGSSVVYLGKVKNGNS